MATALDLTTQSFGKWLVLGKGPVTAHGQFWICQCTCKADTYAIHEDALVEGRAQSCGCDYRATSGQRARFIDLTGQQFGKWLVLSIGQKKGKHIHWRNRCLCQRESSCDGNDLRAGASTQCKFCQNRKPFLTRWLSGEKRFINGNSISFNKWGSLQHKAICICGVSAEVTASLLYKGKCKTCRGKCTGPILHEWFWDLYVIKFIGCGKDSPSSKSSHLWECECRFCGVHVVRSTGKLKSGLYKTCGSPPCKKAGRKLRLAQSFQPLPPTEQRCESCAQSFLALAGATICPECIESQVSVALAEGA